MFMQPVSQWNMQRQQSINSTLVRYFFSFVVNINVVRIGIHYQMIRNLSKYEK
jgi:hypothetical protein